MTLIMATAIMKGLTEIAMTFICPILALFHAIANTRSWNALRRDLTSKAVA